MRTSGFVMILGLFLAVPVVGQDAPVTGPVPAPRAVQPVQFDGRPDEAAWDAARPLPLVQQTPTYRGDMLVETDLRILYDSDFIYLGVKAYDDQPPVATTYRRDGWSGDDDQVAIALDTFNDRENLVIFVLYPTGARIDATIANDARNEMMDVNSDWNTFWDGLSTQDERGWYAEIRIPLSSLRFQTDAEGRVVMGVNAYRFRARSQAIAIFPDVPPDYGFLSFLKPSRGARFSFEGLRSKRPLYFTPYVTGGVGQSWDENDEGTGYVREDHPAYDVGFDVKVGLTSNLTLDVTANTDFAQVEADDQQVNLTRFSLFFPEKRQFFLERTSNFNFSFGGNDGLFYSRRIGIDDGEQVPLLGGARIVGRASGLDVGALTMQAARHRPAGEDRIPSTNFSVLRLKQRVFNPKSYVGGAVTSRIEESLGGEWNTAVGLDGAINLFGDDFLHFALAQTYADGLANRPFDRASRRTRFLLGRDRSDGFRYEVGYARSGVDYDPAVGFQSREDYNQRHGLVGWSTRPPASSPISSYGASIGTEFFYRNADGSMETRQVEADFDLTLRSNWILGGGLSLVREDLREGFDLSDDAEVPLGRYEYASASANITTPSGGPVAMMLRATVGDFFDGRRRGVSIMPRWSPSPRFRLDPYIGYEWLDFADRDEQFESLILRTTASLTLNTRVSLSTLVQYNSAAAAVSANIRFRFNPREGNDFFLVWNEGFNTDRYSGLPVMPVSSSRTLLVKYAYTFLK